MGSFGNINRHKLSQKKRNQNFAMKRLLRQRQVYNRQRILLPAIIIMSFYALLFFITPKIFGISNEVSVVNLPKDNIEVVVPSSGIYYFTVKLAQVPVGSNIVQVETFILQKNKKLYHFLAEYFNLDKREKTYAYKFREAGKYTFKFKVNDYSSTASTLLSSPKIESFKIEKRLGGSLYYSFYFIVLLIAVILVFLLQDYFGPRENYKRIWADKSYQFKDKRIRIFAWSLFGIYTLCIVISILGYGYAGFGDDMHAPVEKLQGDTVYYIN